jgi:hypothetical protein
MIPRKSTRFSWFCRTVSLALELHQRDGCPESGILPYQEIDHDIKRRRTSKPASGRPVQPSKATKRANVARRKPRVAPGKPKSGKKASSAERRPKSQKAAKQAPGAREGSKAAKVLGLLGRPDGATLKELMKSTGWQPHSVRGFLSGTVAKRMKLKLVSAKSEDGERRYSVRG